MTMAQAVALVNKYRRWQERVKELVNEPIIMRDDKTRMGHEKKRRCLKCPRTFRTTNNVRICGRCSAKNDRLGRAAENFIIQRKQEN
jgi:Zn finger protein HypA/HybF involved in hydrogenase expression